MTSSGALPSFASNLRMVPSFAAEKRCVEDLLRMGGEVEGWRGHR
jgi:hypothetical protein